MLSLGIGDMTLSPVRIWHGLLRHDELAATVLWQSRLPRLAVAVLVRSIPYVIASFGEVRDAARARGLDRNPLASVTPVVIQAVAYARTTGDALMARGLGDEDDS